MIYLVLALLLSGCGDHFSRETEETGTQTTLSFNFGMPSNEMVLAPKILGNILSLPSNLKYLLLVSPASSGGSSQIAMEINNGSSLTLPHGGYTFAVLGHVENDHFATDPYCGFYLENGSRTKTLSTASETLSIVLNNTANCLQTPLGDSGDDTYNYDWEIHLCGSANIATISSSTTQCPSSTYASTATARGIKIGYYLKNTVTAAQDFQPTTETASFSTGCMSRAGPVVTVGSDKFIVRGNADVLDTAAPVRIPTLLKVYDDPSCANNVLETHYFPQGIAGVRNSVTNTFERWIRKTQAGVTVSSSDTTKAKYYQDSSSPIVHRLFLRSFVP